MSRTPDTATPTPASVDLPEDRDTRPAPSGTRRSSEAPIAEPWRDVLLRLSTTLPIDIACEDLGRMFLDGVALLFPGAALGICMVQAGRAEPVVLYRLGTGLRRGPERGPTPPFSTYAPKRLYQLDARPRPSRPPVPPPPRNSPQPPNPPPPEKGRQN